MYIDYILFALGAFLLFASAVTALLLFRSRRPSREYRRALREETERIDIISTLRQTTRENKAETPEGSTELLTSQTDINPVQSELSQTEKLSFQHEDGTELLIRSGTDPFFGGGNWAVGGDLDTTPLAGKYELLREIHGGGMSRVFLARNVKLGSEWIVKYIDGHSGNLVDEAEVLKKLNHISLPQIIDIFQNKQGTFLVERYIEGYSLQEALQLRQSIKESQICDWGMQLAQVLHYLHNLDTPIIHCDLKPSNIMVTHDNRLVLIDFGISKRQGITEKAIGITYSYAAPEQFQGRAAASEATRRFGTLPSEHENWGIDARTDLYSAGVILYELVAGALPNWQEPKKIYQYATSGLANVISKCLELSPQKRYQSAKELADALEELKKDQREIDQKLAMRRVATVCCALLLAGGIGSSASAVYINRNERLSLVSMDPGHAVVTAQQSVQLQIQKTTPKGAVVTLEPNQIKWSYSQENVARLDGDRLVGINAGETVLYGQYRNKVLTLEVEVTEPIGELVQVALRYPEGTTTGVYAGNGERDFADGAQTSCSFVSPEYLSVEGEDLYISDSGQIRMLKDGRVSSLHLEPAFLTADLVRGWGEDIYVLTGPWETDEDESYYGFIRISDTGAEFLYYTEAAWSVITDFSFSSDGTLWYIQQNMATGMTTLNTLDTAALEVNWVMDLPDGARNMSFDEENTLYISVPDNGVILRVGKGETEWTYFAGMEGECHFIDGALANFYRPTSLAAEGSSLYVLDFDTVRRIAIDGGTAVYTETLAGFPVEDTNPAVTLGEGHGTVLPASERSSIALNEEEKLLLSDPKNSVVYEISW